MLASSLRWVRATHPVCCPQPLQGLLCGVPVSVVQGAADDPGKLTRSWAKHL